MKPSSHWLRMAAEWAGIAVCAAVVLWFSWDRLPFVLIVVFLLIAGSC